MQTILVIVPKTAFTHWWSDYETLIPMIVPRSSKMIYEDNESGLVTVIVFKKFIQDFKDKAKENGYFFKNIVSMLGNLSLMKSK